MGQLVGKIAQTASSFIPGVGPLVSGGIGAAMGALGGSGAQGGQKGTQQSRSVENIDTTTQQSEDPTTAAFRKLVMGQLAGSMSDAKKPVYGDTETAGVLSSLNDLTQSSIASLRANLGASGSQNSGRYLAGLNGGQQEYRKQAGTFLNQLPLLNRQYKDTQTNQLQQLAAGWLGQAPRSSSTKGSNTTETNGTYSQMTQGPSFLKSLASNIGGLAAGAGGNSLANLLSGLNNKPPAGGFYGGAYGEYN